MKLTFNWLKEFVDFKESPKEIAGVLTMAGLEVESLVPLPKEEGRPDDWVIEIAVTPNRGDCLGILGLAREVAALTGGPLKPPSTSPHTSDPTTKRLVDVKIRSPRLCPRYSARIVQGIQVTPAPSWMRVRLEACGIRCISNVVDITNYVMLETGQPLHAFDLDRLRTRQIIVRQAEGIKKFVTLDGIERELAPEDLLICDGDTPVALAGIMGGRDSEVQSETRAVLLESAHFDPRSVRRTAKRLGLHSEASHRFERGVDPEGTLYAIDRAAFLLREIAGGIPLKGLVDRYPRRTKAAPILVRYQRVKELLGIDLKPREIEGILKSLGLKIQGPSKIGFKGVPPSCRPDLSREADLIEEVVRLHGYNDIPARLPLIRPHGKVDPRLRWERKIRSFLIGEGLTEVINLPFTSEEMNQRFRGLGKSQRSAVSVLNPLVQDSSEMRLSLIPGLLTNLRVHVGQKVRDLAVFELGKIFSLQAQSAEGRQHRDGKMSIQERQHLAGILFGRRAHRGLGKGERSFTFLDLKGLIEGVLESMGMEAQVTWPSDNGASFLHPGKTAILQRHGSVIGLLGEIHPDLCEQWELPAFLVFELDFEELVHYARRDLRVQPLPRYPSVQRDLAVVVDEAFPAQRIINWIKDLSSSSREDKALQTEQMAASLLDWSVIEDVKVFDQYRGSPIPEGKKSLAYTISYRAENRTLTDAEVNDLHQYLVIRIGEVFGAQLRG
ncbi:MAG: phenylalanine--tRNA ligase subunit beta [Candidatus Binatia bacterium]